MLTFQALLKHFPHTLHPCTDGFANQCAIRLSIALEGVEPQFLNDYPTWKGSRCSHGHARSASRLAWYLERKLGAPQTPEKLNDIQGHGIVFYDRKPLGRMNHIDLWAPNLCLPNLDLTTNLLRRQGWQNMRNRNARENRLNTMSWTSSQHAELLFWRIP